jgi:hypothetical protein
MENRARCGIIAVMNSTHLHLSGISARRVILVPAEREGEDRRGRPRVRRYRLGVVSHHMPGGAPPSSSELAPATLSRAVRA